MAVPVYVGEGAVAQGQAAVSPAWGTSPAHQADDIGILIVATANESVTLSTPAGFATLPAPIPLTSGAAAATDAIRLHLFWCRATSGAMASPTVADSGNHNVAKIVHFRGCITSGDPWNIITGDTRTASTAVAIPGGTTTVDDCLIAQFIATANDGANAFASPVNADLTNVTERVDSGGTQGNGSSIGLVTGEKVTAGTFGTTTFTLASSAVQARCSVALKPVAGTTYTPSGDDGATASDSGEASVGSVHSGTDGAVASDDAPAPVLGAAGPASDGAVAADDGEGLIAGVHTDADGAVAADDGEGAIARAHEDSDGVVASDSATGGLLQATEESEGAVASDEADAEISIGLEGADGATAADDAPAPTLLLAGDDSDGATASDSADAPVLAAVGEGSDGAVASDDAEAEVIPGGGPQIYEHTESDGVTVGDEATCTVRSSGKGRASKVPRGYSLYDHPELDPLAKPAPEPEPVPPTAPAKPKRAKGSPKGTPPAATPKPKAWTAEYVHMLVRLAESE
jgi:hypothetical protein